MATQVATSLHAITCIHREALPPHMRRQILQPASCRTTTIDIPIGTCSGVTYIPRITRPRPVFLPFHDAKRQLFIYIRGEDSGVPAYYMTACHPAYCAIPPPRPIALSSLHVRTFVQLIHASLRFTLFLQSLASTPQASQIFSVRSPKSRPNNLVPRVDPCL